VKKKRLKVFIVTPAWKRFDVSRIVFSNFYYIKKSLLKKINVQVVVVANDLNLKIAKKFGLHTVNSPNDYLGRKFNDGYEFAFKNGADIVIPVGSDSLISSDIIEKGVSLSKEGSIVFSSMHSVIREDGKMIGKIKTASLTGGSNKGALWLYRRNLMKRVGFRPCNDKKKRGCDRSTLESLVGKRTRFILNDINFYQHVGIKSKNNQICKYSDYKSQFIGQDANPFEVLRQYYSKDIIVNIEKYYGIK
jgi:hypothetical protein